MANAALIGERTSPAQWLGFLALCAGMFMAVLDIQIVVTSLKVIEEALGIGADRMSWVQTSYLIAEVIAIPLTAVLTRVFTLRWLVTGAIALFTLASVGCALSTGFASLILFRVVQGLAGGVLIPTVFTAVFLLFSPGREQTIATAIAGMLAVLAPALGPITGGLLTEHASWHWLFLVNVGPGCLTIAAAMTFLPRDRPDFAILRSLDAPSIVFMAAGLAALEIGLKQAPDEGWNAPVPLALFLLFALCLALAVDFSLLRMRPLAFGSAISFLLGAGLFGSVYLLPVFLAFVQHMGPVEVGIAVLATGVAQLVAAPISVWLDSRFPSRPLAMAGFGLFALGLAMSGFATRDASAGTLLWPQIARGLAVALCILPVTRFALGGLPRDKVGDASGLYNLSRNLGGAIGIALIDTLLFSRSAEHAARLTELVTASPALAAEALAIPLDDLPDPGDPLGLMGIMDPIQETALTFAINESWLMLAGLTSIALILLALCGPIRRGGGASAESGPVKP
jgi:MFS transporter, DHA2 family, multidrug resistance protein